MDVIYLGVGLIFFARGIFLVERTVTRVKP